MYALKFLKHGSVGRFSSFAWPRPSDQGPGAWVEASDELEPCVNGVHACDIADVPYWLDDELWTIELDGEVVVAEATLVAERGRLVARVDEWNPVLSSAFASASAERVREAAERAGSGRAVEYADDAARIAAKAANARAAAEAADAAARGIEAAFPGGYLDERATQAAWLADRLRLERVAVLGR